VLADKIARCLQDDLSLGEQSKRFENAPVDVCDSRLSRSGISEKETIESDLRNLRAARQFLIVVASNDADEATHGPFYVGQSDHRVELVECRF